ncbi:hypothetical protein GOV09_05110 [Candidatus Woesearchaeota archaeon]|nr:hypothetical protein [Candidatus Woesearchaeota archaeon]
MVSEHVKGLDALVESLQTRRKQGTTYRQMIRDLRDDPNVDIVNLASAADALEKHSWLNPDDAFEDPISMIGYLREHREDSMNLGILTRALWIAGSIPHDQLEEFIRSAGAADYYEQNSWLHTDEIFDDTFEMIEFLREKKPDSLSYSYLARALWTAGKVPLKKQNSFQRAAAAADYFARTPSLHVRQQFKHPEDVVLFLYGQKNDLSMSYRAQALWAGGKVPRKRLFYFMKEAAAADFALKYQDELTRQIRAAKEEVTLPKTHYWYIPHLRSHMDRTVLKSRIQPDKPISEDYFHTVVKYAIILYAHEIIGRPYALVK